jgi:hypothetical protein
MWKYTLATPTGHFWSFFFWKIGFILSTYLSWDPTKKKPRKTINYFWQFYHCPPFTPVAAATVLTSVAGTTTVVTMATAMETVTAPNNNSNNDSGGGGDSDGGKKITIN